MIVLVSFFFWIMLVFFLFHALFYAFHLHALPLIEKRRKSVVVLEVKKSVG